MAKFLVTGGAGFIGSQMVEGLLARGEEARALDNFSTGKRENLEPFLPRAELIEGSITSLETCRDACEGCDYVIHLAALPSVPRSIRDPFETNRVNVEGTLNLLVAARDAGVRRVIYAGSSSAYGDTPITPKHEEIRPLPKSPYAVSKIAGEHYCRAFSQVYGLDTVILRYFNVFGPRQDPTSQYSAVIPKFITLMLRGERPVIFGDGQQSRDFTYVANNVEANLLAARAGGPFNGEIINIACGQPFTLLDLIGELEQILGVKANVEFQPSRAGDVRHSFADIRRAAERLGFQPQVDFHEGLRRTVEFYKSYA